VGFLLQEDILHFLLVEAAEDVVEPATVQDLFVCDFLDIEVFGLDGEWVVFEPGFPLVLVESQFFFGHFFLFVFLAVDLFLKFGIWNDGHVSFLHFVNCLFQLFGIS